MKLVYIFQKQNEYRVRTTDSVNDVFLDVRKERALGFNLILGYEVPDDLEKQTTEQFSKFVNGEQDLASLERQMFKLFGISNVKKHLG